MSLRASVGRVHVCRRPDLGVEGRVRVCHRPDLVAVSRVHVCHRPDLVAVSRVHVCHRPDLVGETPRRVQSERMTTRLNAPSERRR